MGDLMRMNAPIVPISVGAGIKNGNVALIPYFSHQTKCPISCASKIVISAAENGMPISSRAGCAQIHFGLNSGMNSLPSVNAGRPCRKLS